MAKPTSHNGVPKVKSFGIFLLTQLFIKKENKMGKRIILNEEQLKAVLTVMAGDEVISKKVYPVSPQKVLIVKKYLDDNFERGIDNSRGVNGLPAQTQVIVLKNGTSKKPEENTMFKEDVVGLLIDTFKNMFLDKIERELFMNQVLEDWYNNRISAQGLLSKNCLK